jgi:hypothetical protein
MRGNVYRYGRRRAGSIVLATGVALAFVVTGPSSAAAKNTSLRASNHLVKVHARSSVHVRPSVIARAAGHKIA